MAAYQGSCHCGDIRFRVDAEIEGVEICNCSLCAMNAYLHWYVEPEQFRLLTAQQAIQSYQWGTGTSKNTFCRRCGISPFRTPRSDPDLVDVNLRCVEGIDLESIPVRPFDGRHWEQAMEER